MDALEATKPKVESEDSENPSKSAPETVESDEEGSTDERENDLEESIASPEESLEDEDESESVKGKSQREQF